MKRARRAAVLAVLAAACLTAALISGVASRGVPAASAAGPCQLGNKDGQIKHVIYLQFDNTHYTRQPERCVRSRTDATPPELPQGEWHAPDQAPHGAHLPHRGRDPVFADRSLP